MKIYTSYWAQVRNFPTNLIGLNTTVWPPKWRPLGEDKRGIWVIDCPPLKPGPTCEGLCNGSCSPKHPEDCKFLKEYRKQLDEYGIDHFMESLQKLSDKLNTNEKLDMYNFALIVFETPNNPCSEREVLQQWFKDNGVEVEEWQKANS